MSVSETFSKLTSAAQHGVEEFLKQELLKIRQYAPKNCNTRAFHISSLCLALLACDR